MIPYCILRILQGRMHHFFSLLKDTLHASEPDDDRPIPQIRIRRLPLVSADVEVEDVLSVMQRTGAHLAQVVAGGTVIGVVFLADVLDELVGENS